MAPNHKIEAISGVARNERGVLMVRGLGLLKAPSRSRKLLGFKDNLQL